MANNSKHAQQHVGRSVQWRLFASSRIVFLLIQHRGRDHFSATPRNLASSNTRETHLNTLPSFARFTSLKVVTLPQFYKTSGDRVHKDMQNRCLNLALKKVNHQKFQTERITKIKKRIKRASLERYRDTVATKMITIAIPK
eukprot:1370433-Amphidinium_carterae.1